MALAGERYLGHRDSDRQGTLAKALPGKSLDIPKLPQSIIGNNDEPIITGYRPSKLVVVIIDNR